MEKIYIFVDQNPCELRILVVDDSENDRLMFLRYLEGFIVEVTVSLGAALEVLNTKKFDIIILDYRFPDGDGVNFIKQLRINDIMTPVLFVTGFGDERLAVRALKTGASDYLSKDYLTKDMLISAIAEIETKEITAAQAIQAIGFKAREMAKKYVK